MIGSTFHFWSEHPSNLYYGIDPVGFGSLFAGTTEFFVDDPRKQCRHPLRKDYCEYSLFEVSLALVWLVGIRKGDPNQETILISF